MHRGLVLFGFWFTGFLLGIAAFEVATSLPTASSSPLNPELIGASASGLVGSFIMPLGVFLWSRLRTTVG